MLNWVQVGQGYLALRGKPGRSFFENLSSTGCSRMVTLLSSREGGEAIGEIAKLHGLAWIWLPLENGQYPKDPAYTMLKESISVLSIYLDQGESIVIHCAAGIHRTGMLAYALIRYQGYSVEESLRKIGEMRQHTRNGIQDRHLQWGEEVITSLKRI